MSTYDEDLAARKLAEKTLEDQNLVIAQTIAVLLGGVVLPCKPERDYGYNNRFEATFDDGRIVNLRFEQWRNKDKIEVSGSNPRDNRNSSYGKHAGHINVSCFKTPQQIAKDIERRFMPEYNLRYAEAVQQKHESDEYTRKKEARKDLLCTIKGVTRSTYNDSLHVRCNAMYGDIKHVSETGLCNIELSGVSAEQLRVLLGS